MRKALFKAKGDRWAEMVVEVKDGRLSVTGSEGRITTPRKAKAEAREYWESFFEENRNELGRMALEYGKRTPRTAAKFVLASDGDYHGLDVHVLDSGKVYITESCGQITDTLREWFPDVAPALLPWHLNDMHAECEHQEARGETWTTHPSAVCPDCGYKLGSAWRKRELPADVLATVEAL
jgi:hypothetical protein